MPQWSNSPLDQFIIRNLFSVKGDLLANTQISLTNIGLYIIMTTVVIFTYYVFTNYEISSLNLSPYRSYLALKIFNSDNFCCIVSIFLLTLTAKIIVTNTVMISLYTNYSDPISLCYYLLIASITVFYKTIVKRQDIGLCISLIIFLASFVYGDFTNFNFIYIETVILYVIAVSLEHELIVSHYSYLPQRDPRFPGGRNILTHGISQGALDMYGYTIDNNGLFVIRDPHATSRSDYLPNQRSYQPYAFNLGYACEVMASANRHDPSSTNMLRPQDRDFLFSFIRATSTNPNPNLCNSVETRRALIDLP